MLPYEWASTRAPTLKAFARVVRALGVVVARHANESCWLQSTYFHTAARVRMHAITAFDAMSSAILVCMTSWSRVRARVVCSRQIRRSLAAGDVGINTARNDECSALFLRALPAHVLLCI